MCAKALGTKARQGPLRFPKWMNQSPSCEKDNIKNSLHHLGALMASGHVTHRVETIHTTTVYSQDEYIQMQKYSDARKKTNAMYIYTYFPDDISYASTTPVPWDCFTLKAMLTFHHTLLFKIYFEVNTWWNAKQWGLASIRIGTWIGLWAAGAKGFSRKCHIAGVSRFGILNYIACSLAIFS